MSSIRLSRKNFYVIFLTLNISFLTNANAQRNTKTVDDAKITITNCNSSVEVIEAYDLITVAHFYLLANEELFKEKPLLNLFSCISKKYSEYKVIKITVFSDKENLEIAIDNYLNPPPDANPPVIYGNRPARTGYYRANYHRYNIVTKSFVNKKEYFTYSPNPDGRNEIEVQLKNGNRIRRQ